MDQDLKATLSRIAEALDRLAPPAPPSADMDGAEAYIWHAMGRRLEAVPKVNRVDLDLLQGIDRQKATLLENNPPLRQGACRPTMRCCGAHAARARARS